jgi:hypothetical protein
MAWNVMTLTLCDLLVKVFITHPSECAQRGLEIALPPGGLQTLTRYTFLS